jgi:hypothetical protein
MNEGATKAGKLVGRTKKSTHQQSAQNGERNVVRSRMVPVTTVKGGSWTDPECKDESRNARSRLNHKASSEVQDAPRSKPALRVENPVRERAVAENGPQDAEERPRPQLDPSDDAAGDDSNRNEVESGLENEICMLADHRALTGPVRGIKSAVVETSPEIATRSERKTVTSQAPEDGSNRH